jgi:ABC-type phosphate transport system substrate-binding protein
VVDRGVTPELAEQYGEMAQFPLMGQAIVMAYNLPTFNTSDPSLVLLLLSSF